jgi:DCN1-like protein 4/5
MCLPWFRRQSGSKEKSSSKSRLSRTPSKDSKYDLTTTVQKKPSTNKGKEPALSRFSQSRAEALFARYRDPEVKDAAVIGSEGLEKLCQDTQIDMEGAKPLVMAWILEAKELGRFTKQEWDSGTTTWQ